MGSGRDEFRKGWDQEGMRSERDGVRKGHKDGVKKGRVKKWRYRGVLLGRDGVRKR